MSEETKLSLADLAAQQQETTVSKHNEYLDEIAAGGFLPRLQLMTANSEDCKNGKFPINNFSLVAGDNDDIGKEVKVVVISRRPKALDPTEKLQSHDPKESVFQDIMTKADASIDRCMYGVEYLIWIPSKETFSTMLFGSKTMRRESPHMTARIGKMARLTGHEIDTGKYKYWSVQVSPCSEDPDTMPEVELYQKTLEEFNNPKKQEVEIATDEETTGREV